MFTVKTKFKRANITLFLGPIQQFDGADKLPLTNEESVSKIPSVDRLLKGLNEARQVLPNDNAAAFQQNLKKTQHDLWKHPIFYNVFTNRKKSIHELLHRILNARLQLREDSHLSTKFKSRDSSERKESFRFQMRLLVGKVNMLYHLTRRTLE